MESLFFLYSLLQLVKITFCICEDCLVTRVPSFEHQLIQEYHLWSLKAPRLDICFRLCQSDKLCVSLHYNNGTEQCRGYLAAFTSPATTVTTGEVGNNLFTTCKGRHHYGAACIHSSDCHNPNSDCTNDICRCQDSYKFSSLTGSCFKYYYGCYEDSLDNRVLPEPEFKLGAMTNAVCISHCRYNGYSLAGTQYSESCFCGNITLDGYNRYNEIRCNSPCGGDNTQMCGGFYALSIYNTQQ